MPDDEDLVTIVSRMHENRVEIQRLQQAIVDDTTRLATAHGKAWGDRSIEEHLLALAPQEGFDITDITDHDRRQMARAILDAYMFGIGWLSRDDDHGFKREDPLRIEVRDKRMT